MEFDLSIKLITAAILILFFVFRSRFTKHYKRFTPRQAVKYIILAVLLFFYFSGYFDFAQFEISKPIQLSVGPILIFLGLFLFFWAHYHLGKNWSPIIEKKFSKSRYLVTSGPYKYIRHPIYSASFITMIGFLFFTRNWLLTGIPFVILLLFYMKKIPKEEDELIRNFGPQYRHYMKETPRLLPGF